MMLIAMLCGGSAAFAWTAGHTVPDFAPTTVNASASGPLLVARTPVRAGPRPVRIVIPTIAVNADVEPLHRTANGTLNSPPRWDDAGWYADGVVPGQQGPAVIVGHVDSARDGPAVFYRLPRLRRGDDVLVETSDGQNHRFVVDTTRAFKKTSFPTDLVYGPTPLAALRLITCTGSFDRATHNYSENLVVTAYAA
jgi:sortase (surface protein transpeptidase)